MTEIELEKISGNIILTKNNGEIIKGRVFGFTKALDNEPEVASIDINLSKNGEYYLTEIYLPEIKEIKQA